MRSRASIFSFFLVLVACGGSAPTASPDTSAGALARDDGDAILAKVRERYATTKTYADEGTFRIVYRETDGREKRTVTGRFKTRWRAPDRLLFVMHEGNKELSVGKPPDGRSLAESLASLHGASNGLTGVVPLWLVEGFKPTHRYQLKGRWPCGDHECHMLETVYDATDKTMLLVDTTTFALRRLVRHTLITPKQLDPETLAALPPAERERAQLRQVDPFITDDDIVFTPTFDAALDESAFDGTKASSSPDRPGR